MSRFYKAILLVTVVCLITTCDTSVSGELNENQSPNTFLTVNNISRSDDNRLSSQINISWWGVDPDGFILFYEYAINDTSEGAWTKVTATDSTFILPITVGQQTDDVLFKIRAVDDDSARDPNGARLVYPIVNTNPTVQLNNTQIPPDTLYSVASFGWTIADADGLGNISRTEIAINDTTNGWTEIPIQEDSDQIFISVEVDNSTERQTSGEVFLGRTYVPTTIVLDNIQVGERNTFYVRTIDQAGASSNVDTTSWFVKPQKSKVLFLNDVSGSNSLSTQAFHLQHLKANGIEPDIWMINDGTAGGRKGRLSEAFPETIDPTLTKTLDDWDHIYWVSNSINRNINFVQEIAADFIDKKGNFFINIPISDGNTTNEDPILDFLSIDSFAVREGLVLEYVVESGTTLQSASSEFPELVASRDISKLPLKETAGATQIYTADFIEDNISGADTPYEGPETVAIINAEENIVYFGLDLQNLDGNDNIADLINTFCIQFLGFEQ